MNETEYYLYCQKGSTSKTIRASYVDGHWTSNQHPEWVRYALSWSPLPSMACPMPEHRSLSKPPMQPLGPQEPPQDPRIFNRRQPDGSFRPVSEFFKI